MKIKFKNLGPIESGEIDFNDLKGINLIIGKNNTGKTYLSNLLYSFFKIMRQIGVPLFMLSNIKSNDIIDYNLLQEKCEKEIELNLKQELITTFHVHSDFFKNFEIVKVDLTDEIDKLKEKNIESKILIMFKDKNKTIITKIVNHKIIFEIKDYYENSKNIKLEYDGTINSDFETKEVDLELLGLYSLLNKYSFDKNVKIHFFPAERSGILLFYNQLLESQNNILRKLELTQDMNLLKKIQDTQNL